jgi:GlpG protein
MLWLFQLGTTIETRRGTWPLLCLVLASAVISNLAQYYLTGLPNFGGMSGVVLALFGYVWMKGLYEPDQGLGLDQNTVLMMILYLGVTMSLDLRMAHFAHLAGLGVGMIVALGPHLRASLMPTSADE